jgi:hypothetical protein
MLKFKDNLNLIEKTSVCFNKFHISAWCLYLILLN